MTVSALHLPPERVAALAGDYAAALAPRRRATLLGFAVLAALTVIAAWTAEVRPAVFAANAWRFTSYLTDIAPKLSLASLPADLAEWFWGWRRWLRLLAETLLIAYVATLVGAAGAFVLGFAGARNLVRSRAIRFVVRRALEFCRTVPELVFALIFVVAFGLGPVAGVLALTIHTLGALGKLFAEVVENADMRPVEGVLASGATWPEMVRFAVVPGVLSNFASYALLRFEINVRGAAVMGFVGAGGIGQDLLEAVRKFYFSDVSAILTLIILAVVVIDLGTERLRHALLGREAR